MKNKKGFTLVELLVVIAIIGILSTVAVVNLNSARDKAKVAAVQGSLTGIIPSIILCHDDGNDLLDNSATPVDCAAGASVDAGDSICASTGAALWPTLPTGWSYVAGSCESDDTAGTFNYSATDGATTPTVIVCNENGCS